MVERLPVKKKRKVFIRAWHVIVMVEMLGGFAHFGVIARADISRLTRGVKPHPTLLSKPPPNKFGGATRLFI